MPMRIDRREALLGLTSSVLLANRAHARFDQQAWSNSVFAHGVASGDPASDSVVLWTRITGLAEVSDVDWVVATDKALKNIVAHGVTSTSRARDFTVKVIPEGLPSGQRLFYQFRVGGVGSPIGRTQTLATGNLESLVLAVASCSNFPFGRFNGYQAIAEDPDIDIVVHLGDYIYEYSETGYGAEAGRRLGRIHEPRHETVTLEDYRRRHAQYKADPGSLAMHAAHPLIATWDDHESTNNPWSGGAQNHQPDEGAWPDRRSVSLRAYYEWMPVREPEVGQAPELRRGHFSFGDLASIVTVETRHMARAKQIEFSEHRDALTSPEAAAEFYETVVGAEDRKMISSSDRDFFEAALRQSKAQGQPWRIFLNQTILANVISPELSDPTFIESLPADDESVSSLVEGLTSLGALKLPANMDAWDGYPVARERLYEAAISAGVSDLLAVTGDTHVFWQNRLFDSRQQPMGLELGTSAITSPRGFSQLGQPATERFDQLTAEQNRSVDWVDGRNRGFIKLTLEHTHATADFVALSSIEDRRFTTEVVRSVDIRRDGDVIDYV
ncbi:MAG: alkaline phosphatase D family protein [Pseudomonadota bacterium]